MRRNIRELLIYGITFQNYKIIVNCYQDGDGDGTMGPENRI